MDKLNNRRDHTEKKVNATGKSDSERWKRSSLYGVPTDKPRPESTSEAARESTSKLVRESTSGPKDHIRYHDGRLRLAQQRQQAYQKDSYITPNLSASSIYRYRRLGSYGNDNNSNPSALGVPKGDKGSINPPIHVDMDLTRLGRWGPDQGNFGLNSDSDSSSQQQRGRGCCCWPWQRQRR